jgi:hypothetical protein
LYSLLHFVLTQLIDGGGGGGSVVVEYLQLLPGEHKTFDLKTRAIVSIRRNVSDAQVRAKSNTPRQRATVSV